MIKAKIPEVWEILEEVDDLKKKKKTLLKLRRACLLNNNPRDL